jgi:hypothetical protein
MQFERCHVLNLGSVSIGHAGGRQPVGLQLGDLVGALHEHVGQLGDDLQPIL